jgi:hypothetical protein
VPFVKNALIAADIQRAFLRAEEVAPLAGTDGNDVFGAEDIPDNRHEGRMPAVRVGYCLLAASSFHKTHGE